MEQKDIQKVYNGDAMVFTKGKFWGGLSATIFVFIALWLGTFLWWGGGLQATVTSHIEDTTVHEIPKDKALRIERMLNPYMRKEVIELKFESLDEKYDDIKSELKEIKKILQSK